MTTTTKALYMCPFTDFAFKRIFKTPKIAIDFINSVLERFTDDRICDVTFIDTEFYGERKEEKRLVVDVLCETHSGDYIQIEMQNAVQPNFLNRAFEYMCRVVSSMPKVGDKKPAPQKFYAINMLNYPEPEFKGDAGYMSILQVKNQENKVFFRNRALIFIELPKFAAACESYGNRLEQWLYTLTNLENFTHPPASEQDEILKELLMRSYMKKLNKSEKKSYVKSVEEYQDVKAACQLNREEGFKEGLEKGLEKGVEKGRTEEKLELCLNMIARGYSDEEIATIANIPIEEVVAMK